MLLKHVAVQTLEYFPVHACSSAPQQDCIIILEDVCGSDDAAALVKMYHSIDPYVC